MEVNELMIGDWVHDTYTKRPFQMQGVNQRMGKGLEPIKITTEFLEKNFERNSENAVENVFGIFDDFYDLFIYPLQDGMWTMEYCSCEFNIPDQRVHVSWVHELQHFLTHCGIEKELIMEE